MDIAIAKGTCTPSTFPVLAQVGGAAEGFSLLEGPSIGLLQQAQFACRTYNLKSLLEMGLGMRKIFGMTKFNCDVRSAGQRSLQLFVG
jgi:hypothetical protein